MNNHPLYRYKLFFAVTLMIFLAILLLFYDKNPVKSTGDLCNFHTCGGK